MKLLLIILLLVRSFPVHADYLLVQRTGNLRAAPSGESEILEKVTLGDTLVLLDEEQTNGYYHVGTLASRQDGWIYRTLVRRVQGDLDVPENFSTGTVVEVRVLDVGAGLCNLIKLAGDKYVIYDAGGDLTASGERTVRQIHEYIPIGSRVELLVLSHTDADHIIAASQVLRDYRVKKVLWGGYDRSMTSGSSTQTYRRFLDMLEEHPQTEQVNLNARDSTIRPGTRFTIGAAHFIFLCGFGVPPHDWDLDNEGEKLNSVSIVMKLEFGGNSILFTGDAVGRHLTSTEDALIATEKFLVEQAAAFLPSTVLIAPHHGAKNGSSRAFVNRVQPHSVIFSAGHKHKHPTARTANIYLQTVPPARIFRTDRGDDEGGEEWKATRIAHCTDKYGDDTIQIQLRANGTYRVFYIEQQNFCAN